MRQLIQKLGRINTIIIITVFSVLASVFITFLVYYLKQNYLGYSISIIVPLIVAPLASWPLMTLLMKIDNLEKEMRALATFDSLTGLLGRRAFFHDAKSFIDFAEREQITFSVIALDIDKFKNINDSYGHAAGDDVLRHFANTIKTITRKGDLIGRTGGEEFALLLPNTSEDIAYTLSERLHSAIRESVINHEDSSIKYTVSMGLISVLPKKSDNIENILKQADQSLYIAKEKGRNHTRIFNDNQED